MSEKENDILWREYFYPGTNILINYMGIHDADKLKEIEATNTFDRLLELRDKPIPSTFGKEYLNSIHKYLFDDLYPFAGIYRKVNMTKGNTTFLFIHKVDDIDQFLDKAFEKMNDSLPQCMSKNDLCEIMGQLYSDLIYCHPYREGNGRTIREFIRQFSISKSKELGLGELELDWRFVDKDQLNQDALYSHLFPEKTIRMFYDALRPVSKESLKI